MWLGATNRAYTQQIIPPPSGAFPFAPGFRVRLGNYGSMDTLANYISKMDSIISLDVNNQIKGLVLSPAWAQLEGPTLGQYDNFGSPASENGFTKIAALISHLKGYNPPRDLTIAVNCGGNGRTGNDTGFNPSFCPAYMNSSTYGGGMAQSSASGQIVICYWNANVANRLIALFQAYNNQFGKDTPTGGIYRWDPFQEISIAAGLGGYSPSALLAVWPTLMSGLRAAAPNTLIFIKPTFINPNDGSNYPALMSAALSNHISWGNEDMTNTQVDWGQKAYLGQWASTPTNHTTANAGAPDWDFHANVDPAELWLTSNANAAIPPASKGSGRIYDGAPTFPGIMTGVNLYKCSHVDIYCDAFGGPNVNRRVFSSTAPANPTPGPGAGLVAAHPNIIDVLTGNTSYSGVTGPIPMPWTHYPIGYP